mmetsp:Transcript_9473/g.14614  ORF Transcript_9473/g.14614 Transcript_9473/m.14614 type:complete len:97 (+) Transcript_9473:712-1002(+)
MGSRVYIIAAIQINIPMNVERIFRNWFLHVITIEEVDKVGMAYMVWDGDIMSSFLVKLQNQAIQGALPVAQQLIFSLLQKKNGSSKMIVWTKKRDN